MTSHEIRRSFVDFFVGKGHTQVPSATLVPDAMSTTLFTIAGMEQFVGVFLGNEAPPAPRVVTVQRCLRVAGGKNDLDNVGRSGRHGTLLEMLGNFSFGDYYKREAIAWAWEFLVKVLGLSPERLSATVYVDDDEAEKIWRDEIGLPPERVGRRREDNFWDMGPTGPCGPCSEIFYAPGGDAEPLELWNLVFQQYDRTAAGELKPLPTKCIDTGMGFERLCMAMAGKTSIFETDLYTDIIAALPAEGKSRLPAPERLVHRRIIADHARAATFMAADGIAPSNTDRGYVMRFLTRRAIRSGRLLGLPDGFFSRLVPAVVKTLEGAYPELRDAQPRVIATLEGEERQFDQTLARGSRQLEALLKGLRNANTTTLPGRDIFKLHDTYGFPPELVAEIAGEQGVSVDMAGYRAAMEEQRQRARRDTESTRPDLIVTNVADRASRGPTAQSQFVGYTGLNARAKVIALFDSAGAPVKRMETGAGTIVLDRTPFYAERGGQMGDRGVIARGDAAFDVKDTYYADKTYRQIVHAGSMKSGAFAVGDEVEAMVDPHWRREIRRHHSVTHLLQRALKDIVGDTVAQRGSQVYSDRTRFDFDSPSGALSKDSRAQVSARVNELIRADFHIREDTMPFAEAVAKGAIYMKGENYGDVVRVVQFGPSIELCGGTHVASTGEIGHFVLLAESAIGAGIRRVEGVVSESADRYVERVRATIEQLGSTLSAPIEKLPETAERLTVRERELEKTIAGLRAEIGASSAAEYLSAVRHAGDIPYLAVRAPADGSVGPRELADSIRARWSDGVLAVIQAGGDKVSAVVSVSPQLVQRGVSAKTVLNDMLGFVGGKGGGSAALAQGGGRDPSGVDAALAAVERSLLKVAGG